MIIKAVAFFIVVASLRAGAQKFSYPKQYATSYASVSAKYLPRPNQYPNHVLLNNGGANMQHMRYGGGFNDYQNILKHQPHNNGFQHYGKKEVQQPSLPSDLGSYTEVKYISAKKLKELQQAAPKPKIPMAPKHVHPKRYTNKHLGIGHPMMGKMIPPPPMFNQFARPHFGNNKHGIPNGLHYQVMHGKPKHAPLPVFPQFNNLGDFNHQLGFNSNQLYQVPIEDINALINNNDNINGNESDVFSNNNKNNLSQIFNNDQKAFSFQSVTKDDATPDYSALFQFDQNAIDIQGNEHYLQDQFLNIGDNKQQIIYGRSKQLQNLPELNQFNFNAFPDNMELHKTSSNYNNIFAPQPMHPQRLHMQPHQIQLQQQQYQSLPFQPMPQFKKYTTVPTNTILSQSRSGKFHHHQPQQQQQQQHQQQHQQQQEHQHQQQEHQQQQQHKQQPVTEKNIKSTDNNLDYAFYNDYNFSNDDLFFGGDLKKEEVTTTTVKPQQQFTVASGDDVIQTVTFNGTTSEDNSDSTTKGGTYVNNNGWKPIYSTTSSESS